MKNKGFLLVDSLISILVVSSIAIVCVSVYSSLVNYENGYLLYKDETNSRLEAIYSEMGECEKCVIEEDLSLQEQ